MSIIICFMVEVFDSRIFKTESNFVEKRFKEVTIAPFGPRLYSDITFL